MREQTFIRPMLFMHAGLLVWAAHFSALYALNALVCARGLAAVSLGGFPIVPLAITVLTLVAVAGIAAAAYLAWKGRQPVMPERSGGPEAARFVRDTTLLVCGIGMVGVVWDALPAFIVPACA